MIDNFDRHVWQVVGGTMGVALTAFFGWPIGVGWLIGWGGGGIVIYAILTDRLVVRRRRSLP